MHIRPENIGDYEEIYQVVQRAFESAEHADGNEQDLVTALRGGEAYIPDLALVAVEDDRIIGHIMFTEMHVGGDIALALAPVSVLPEYQGKGAGSALIEEGHHRAAAMGYTHSIVLGSDQYYPRFGYSTASEFGIETPDGVPEEFFMVLRLREDVAPISGAVEYAAEFGM